MRRLPLTILGTGWMFITLTLYMLLGLHLDSDGFWMGGIFLWPITTGFPFMIYSLLPKDPPKVRSK